MGENSKIEWTDHTFNPWRGCTKVATGCLNCYADRLSQRNPAVLGVWGDKGTRVVASEEMWALPLRWNRQAGADASRTHSPRVFCASLADVFEDWRGPMMTAAGKVLLRSTDSGDGSAYWTDKPIWLEHPVSEMDRIPNGFTLVTMDDVRQRLFRLIDKTPFLDWLLLTKRPENVHWKWFELPQLKVRGSSTYRTNVWLGVSVACQADAERNLKFLPEWDEMVPVTFVSAEPLVGPVSLSAAWQKIWPEYPGDLPRAVGWVIVGGESGLHGREMRTEWATALRDECRESGIPFFFKQWGQHAGNPENVLEGVRHLEFPQSAEGVTDVL